jgi:hypothetical protein
MITTGVSRGALDAGRGPAFVGRTLATRSRAQIPTGNKDRVFRLRI